MDQSFDSKLNAELEDAEKLLLQGDYFSAEKCSRKALSSAARLTDPDEKNSFGDRAAAVLLQALFETNRFSNARPSLTSAFGSMETTPANSVLVWLSLALDTDEKCTAQSLMLTLLQAGPCRGAPVCRWNHRQYLALIHLYAIEVLLPALRDPSEVRLWLQRQPFLPLDPREKQFLEDEVEAAAAASLLAENGTSGDGSGNGTVNSGAGRCGGQGIEPSGSTDLDHMLGGGGGRLSDNILNTTTLPSVNAGGTLNNSGKRVTDYSSMALPTDQISPMKNNKAGSGGGGGGVHGGRHSPAVAIAADNQQQNPPYLMSFSPVPSDLPFGSLAEYEHAQHSHNHLHNDGNHHHLASSSVVSSPTHPNALSPRPSGDLGVMTNSSSRNSNTTTNQLGDRDGSYIELDWLGKLQQAAFDAAGSVYTTINDLVIAGTGKSTIGSTSNNSTSATDASTSSRYAQPQRKTTAGPEGSGSNGGSNSDESMSPAALATVVGVSIFAYAMYSERLLIKNSAKRAWRGVEDLVKIAFLFTPNPMTQSPMVRG
jgi:hypothetical protein